VCGARHIDVLGVRHKLEELLDLRIRDQIGEASTNQQGWLREVSREVLQLAVVTIAGVLA
jgi:hypothetical protein